VSRLAKKHRKPLAKEGAASSATVDGSESDEEKDRGVSWNLPAQSEKEDEPVTLPWVNSFDELVTPGGAVFKDALKMSRTAVITQAEPLVINHRFRALSSRDWRGLVGIKPGSVEYTLGESLNSMSETIMAVVKTLGPSKQSVALLGVHEDLQNVALALGAPYKDRSTFLQKHSESMDSFDTKSLKDLLSVQAKAPSVVTKARKSSFTTMNQNQQFSRRSGGYNDRRWQNRGRGTGGVSGYQPFTPPSSSSSL
jgi:hypothetical protein